MITEAALITVSCVLFVQMGLSRAIQDTIGFRSKILSCPRCCTFWPVLAYMLATGKGIVMSVAASFISSYCAMWIALLYDSLATLYNWLYEQLSETDEHPAEDAEAGQADPAEAGCDEVS